MNYGLMFSVDNYSKIKINNGKKPVEPKNLSSFSTIQNNAFDLNKIYVNSNIKNIKIDLNESNIQKVIGSVKDMFNASSNSNTLNNNSIFANIIIV